MSLKKSEIEDSWDTERANLESLINSAPVAIFTVDSDYAVIKANKKAEEFFGRQNHEIINRRCGNLIYCIHSYEHQKGCGFSDHCPFCPIMNAIKRAVLEKKPTKGREMEFVLDRGSCRKKLWVRFSVEPLRLQNNPNCAVIALDDISDRKRLEVSLIEERENIRAITDSAKDAILMMNPDGNISFWNRAAESILGYTAQEAIGTDLHLLLVPYRYHNDYKEALKRFHATGEGNALGKNIEILAKHKNGNEIPMELALSAVERSDGWYAIGILRDITERKRSEKELKEAKELAESANRAKSEFLANMSHEIRTPMNVIIGMSDLIKDTPLNKEQQEYALMLSHSSEILLSLIEDILDFSKIEAGKIELESIDFDLRKLIGKIVDMLKIKASEKGLVLYCDIDADVPNFLNGDPNRLRQVLLNLINNALKFTSKGQISIKIKNEDRDSLNKTEQESLTISFEVADTGIGIPTDRLDRMFQPFSQADASTTRRYGGTGLGLAISKNLVELMGGTISVKSKYGQGAAFKFTSTFKKGLDRALNPKFFCNYNDTSLTSAVKANLTGIRVLMAEDNEFNQRLALIVLQKMGIAADVVCNGKEVIEAVCKNSYDIILMDVQMPEMDGIEAAKQVRKQGYYTPIIAMTANATPQDRLNCIQAGMDDYISKPINSDKLRSIILKNIKDNVESMSKSEEHLPAGAIKDSISTSSLQPSDYKEIFNKYQFLVRVNGDESAMMQLISMIPKYLAKCIEQLKTALDKGDIQNVVLYAHNIKGFAANCSSNRLRQAAYKIEVAAKNQDIETVRLLISEIEHESNLLLSVLNEML